MAHLEFTGTDRFAVQRKLGAGGMGVVYHARDRERQADVALKVLLRLDADGIYKLKAEFRALADVSHPNLVGLYELVSSGEQWFFTMELVEGVDFLSYVRNEDPALLQAAESAPTAAAIAFDATLDSDEQAALAAGEAQVRIRRVADEARLRPALRQLAEGVAAIHAAGKLHRDIKPSNAMVAADGRVVLLDFGLVSASHGTLRKRESAHDNAISGTPAYMAPEQATGQGVSAASDWYAVGVMLYEALTGQLPFSGSWYQLLDAKLHHTPIPPRELVATAPADLADLCERLLRAVPTERPNEAEILQILGVRPALEALPVVNDDGDPPFLGRGPQLQALQEALEAAMPGRPVAVHVKGPGGIGKTALVEHFLEGVRERGVLVLAGRCHEREAVPYKAFDALVDALTRFLLRLHPSEIDELLPREAPALARIFPVLRRVPAIEALPQRDIELDDKRGLRRRAFVALKVLLQRLCRTRKVAILLDDLHWGDIDSVELLASLLEPPDAPGALYLLSYRDEEARSNPVLAALRELVREAQGDVRGTGRFRRRHAISDSFSVDAAGRWRGFGVEHRELAVGPLAREEGVELALRLLGTGDALSLRRAEVIAKEAAGSPLFVVELVRYRDAGDPTSQTALTDAEITLERVLRHRVDALAGPARQLLEVAAVAGKPTRQRVVFAAAGLGREEQTALARLRSGHFVRTSGPADTDTIETFHNRIREVVTAQLDPGTLKQHHLALAQALSTPDADGRLDVDALAWHWLGAGDEVQGLDYSLQAARRAHEVYANHDAVRHYDAALRILARRPDAVAVLDQVQREAAAAARQAGLYARAGELLQACLQRAATPTERAELHVGLGQVAQERGDTDGAIVQLETALQLFGKKAPRNLVTLGLQAAGQLLLHGIYSVFPRLAGARSHDPTLQKRADTMFALIRIYYFIDVAKVVWAGVNTIVMSRRLPRQADVALAYSFFGVLLFGMGQMQRSRRWCEDAVDVARQAQDPVAEAVAILRLGTHAVFANDLDRAGRHLDDAADLFREVGEMWELQTALMLAATNRFLQSDFRGAEPVFEEMGGYGVQLHAIMHQGWALGWAPFCRYLLGEEDAATTRASLDRALDFSARARDVANQCAAMMHATNVAVREGQVESAAGLAVRTYDLISRYLVQVPFLQCALVDAAEAALFALENGVQTVPRRQLLRIARKASRKALGMAGNYPYLHGPALRVQARLVALERGPRAADGVFRKALDVLQKTPNRWETGVCFYDAARCLPDRRARYAAEARAIFEQIGAVAEVRRLERELGPAT